MDVFYDQGVIKYGRKVILASARLEVFGGRDGWMMERDCVCVCMGVWVGGCQGLFQCVLNGVYNFLLALTSLS